MRSSSQSRALRVAGAALAAWEAQTSLTPVKLEGTEGINSLFTYRLVLRTPNSRGLDPGRAANLRLHECVGRELTVLLEQHAPPPDLPPDDGDGLREISGMVTSARFLRSSERHVFYELTLRPWLHLATLSADCRIFQNQSVVEITQEVLAGYIFPVENRLSARYPPREMQTQFNESDADFLMRLWEEWGINWHFEHSDGKHRLVLCDHNGGFRPNRGGAYRALRFHDGDGRIDEECVDEFQVVDSLTSGSYRSRDYDYTRPRADLESVADDARETGQAHGEVYRWRADDGSDYSQPNAGTLTDANRTEAQGDMLARLRMDALRQHGLRAHGRGALRGVAAGHSFRLRDHPQDAANGEYLTLSASLLVEDIAETSVPADTSHRPAQQWRVELAFEAHPIREPLRPDLRRPKPRLHGTETAQVVGPRGAQGVESNIHTDHLGRIKIQFPWDRRGQNDQNSSCWVRVSSAWAGNQSGAMQLPRVGQEVVVSFVGGDPDLPLVTGRVFDQFNLPPWNLPGQEALSGFRSRELTPGGGNDASGRSNHLLLDDTEGKMQAQLKSDHAHSSLSLGHIARVEDHEGRKDERGEGFELRSDAHGALRAALGLLLTTYAREAAAGSMKEVGEAIHRLQEALMQHEAHAQAAVELRAQSGGDQQRVAAALQKLQQQAKGSEQPLGELTQPHMVLASAAGMVGSAVTDMHLATGHHAAITSGAHTSLSAGDSLLASAAQAIRMIAHREGAHFVAAHGDIELQAQHDNVRITAQQRVEITSNDDWVDIKAKKGIRLSSGSTCLELTPAMLLGLIAGGFALHAGTHSFNGPQSLAAHFDAMPSARFNDRYRLTDPQGRPVALARWEATRADGSVTQGTSDAQGFIDILRNESPERLRVRVL